VSFGAPLKQKEQFHIQRIKLQATCLYSSIKQDKMLVPRSSVKSEVGAISEFPNRMEN